MQVIIKTAELTKALYRVHGLTSKKNLNQNYNYLLLEATKEQEFIVSTLNQEIGLSGIYQAEVKKPGKIAMQLHNFYDLVKTISAEEIILEEIENNWLLLKAGNCLFKLVGMLPDNVFMFPKNNSLAFTIPLNSLMKMIDYTLFCTSLDEGRYTLNGVYCETLDKQIFRMVALDGHRLALSEITLSESAGLKKGVIIPRKTFMELKRILADMEDKHNLEVQVLAAPNSLLFKISNLTLYTRLIDGLFPDYKQLIPESGQKKVSLLRSVFIDALKRAALIAEGKAYSVAFKFNAEDLEIVADDPKYGSLQESLKISYAGEPLAIGFNAKYLLEVLTLLNGEEVTLELTDQLSPLLIKLSEEPSLLAIIMPMRL